MSSSFVPLHDNVPFRIDGVSDFLKFTDMTPSIEVVSCSICCLMVNHPSEVFLFELLLGASKLQVVEEQCESSFDKTVED